MFLATHWLRLPARWRRSTGGHRGCFRAGIRGHNEFVSCGLSTLGGSVSRVSCRATSEPHLAHGENARVVHTDAHWLDLLQHNQEWYDFRPAKLQRKVDSAAPDFQHEASGVMLWLKDSPEWVRAELNPRVPEHWSEILRDSLKWVDYREAKKSGWVKSNFPDFKHTSDGRALWLSPADLRAIPDLELRLAPLQFAPATHERRVMFEHIRRYGRQWECYWEAKEQEWVKFTHPDFLHSKSGQTVWMSPKEVPSAWAETFQAFKFGPPMRAAIHHILKYPDEWIYQCWQDGFSGRKRRRLYFLHAESNRSYTLYYSGLPENLKQLLSKTTFQNVLPQSLRRRSTEAKWKDLIQNKGDWEDMRNHKSSHKAPDFRHKTGVGLWLWAKGTPFWVHGAILQLEFAHYSESRNSTEEAAPDWNPRRARVAASRLRSRSWLRRRGPAVASSKVQASNGGFLSPPPPTVG